MHGLIQYAWQLCEVGKLVLLLSSFYRWEIWRTKKASNLRPHAICLMEMLIISPYHRKRKLNSFNHISPHNCGPLTLWFRNLLFMTLTSGIGGFFGFLHILRMTLLLHYAIISLKWGRQKTTAEPLQYTCFQLKIDDVNEQCQPSVDILICHWKKMECICSHFQII